MRPVTGTVPRADHAVGPLAGTLVLDFGQTAVGPVSAMFLAFLGAAVIKVEPPRGELGRYDVSRRHDAGFTFLSTNLGKYGVVLDFKDPADHAYARALIAQADVVIDNFRSPDVMRRLGLDYFDVLRPSNPTLVYLQASSFQGRGPLRDLTSFEWVAQALSGCAGTTGRAGGPAGVSRGTAYLDWTGAMMNTIAMLAGLHQRHATGEGCMLSTSQFATSVFVGASRLAGYQGVGGEVARLGHDFGRDMLDRAFETADGYTTICAPTEATWRRLMGVVGLPPDTPVDPSGTTLEPALKSASSEEWLARLRAARVPAGIVRAAATLVEALRNTPEIVAADLVRQHDAQRGGVLYAAPPWEVVDIGEVAPRAAPELGEHTDLVRRLLAPGATTAALEGGRAPGTWMMHPVGQTAPLAGANVVEIGTGLAVGTAGMVLAQLGATVTKVLPLWGEPALGATAADSAAVAEQLHHDKTVERFDLTEPEDKSRLLELVRQSSAVIVAGPVRFRRLFALGPDDLRAVQPDIVYCGLTGYGTSGPAADSPATEFDVQVTSGMTRQLGRCGELPVRQGFHLVSVNTGYAAAQAVLAGLLVSHHHEADGRHFEVSLLRTAVALNGWNITAESGHDGVEGKQVQAYGWPPDHGYPCLDRPVLISIRNNDQGWVKFLAALDRVDLLADERFSTLEALRANEWRLPGLLAPTTSEMTSDEVRRIVNGSGGDVVLVLEPGEVLDHPQSVAQHLVRAGEHLLELPVDLVTR